MACRNVRESLQFGTWVLVLRNVTSRGVSECYTVILCYLLGRSVCDEVGNVVLYSPKYFFCTLEKHLFCGIYRIVECVTLNVPNGFFGLFQIVAWGLLYG